MKVHQLFSEGPGASKSENWEKMALDEAMPKLHQVALQKAAEFLNTKPINMVRADPKVADEVLDLGKEFNRASIRTAAGEKLHVRAFNLSKKKFVQIETPEGSEMFMVRESLMEKRPAGAPPWRDSDAPDAEGRFRDLGINDLADWLIRTRGGDARRIYGSLNQQIVFNRNKNPTYAKKMESVRNAVKRKLAARKEK